jgi:methyl-accepting chemotaxis protein
MQRLKLALSCLFLLSLTGLALQAFLLLREATRAAHALPLAISSELQQTRRELLCQVDAVRKDLTAQIETTRGEILDLVNGQATAIQGNAMTAIREQGAAANAQIAATLSLLDRRTGDALARVDATLAAVNTLETDARPVLGNSAALVKDLQDSLDDNYYDIKATIESSTVAVTGVARAAEAVGNAAPSITGSFDSTAKSVAREADALTKPPTFWSGVRTWLAVISRALALAF